MDVLVCTIIFLITLYLYNILVYHNALIVLHTIPRIQSYDKKDV